MAGDDSAPTGELTESTNPRSSNPADPLTSQGPLGESTAQVTEPKSHGDGSQEPDASAPGEVDDGEDYSAMVDQDDDNAKPPKGPASAVRLATTVGLVFIVALAGLVGWETFRACQSHQADEQRNVFLQIGRQAALNLTTVSYTEVDADVQRILASATGAFYNNFATRKQPFVDVVKQVQSKSVGTVTEAGLESVKSDQAQVLVAVSVQTSTAGAEQQDPRAWRMRIDVQKVGNQAKVSNVEFVP